MTRWEYRVVIREADYGIVLYRVQLVEFFPSGAVKAVTIPDLEDTDPGVIAGRLLGMREAFEQPPVDLRQKPPKVLDYVLKT